MTKLNPIQINQYLDKLFTFVEGLPMGEKGKEYIKFKFLIDFLDTWQFDDEENDFTFEELDKLHPADKAARLSKSLAAITRAELFENMASKIKDPEWNNQLKEILGAEITFSKEQADLLTKAPKPTPTPGIANDDEMLIVEELENRLAIEAVEYKRKLMNFGKHTNLTLLILTALFLVLCSTSLQRRL
jgi:hypothetical protein